MNIQGLDYNTQREKLVMPEYGREIQKMVDYAVALPDKEERQRCAESIIEVMARMTPQGHDSVDYEQNCGITLRSFPVSNSTSTGLMTLVEPRRLPRSLNRWPILWPASPFAIMAR